MRVFIAHSSDDKPIARFLYHVLRLDGFDPWLDEEKLVGGQDWEHVIAEEIEASDIFLALLSDHAVGKKGYVNKELRIAIDAALKLPSNEIYIVPIRYGDLEIPRNLSNLHFVAADVGFEKLASLYSKIRRSLLEKLGTEHLIGLQSLAKLALTQRRSIPMGAYVVAGKNPNGQPYFGKAEVLSEGAGIVLIVRSGGETSRYAQISTDSKTSITFNGPVEVTYEWQEGGVLMGVWEDRGIEFLIPSAHFPH